MVWFISAIGVMVASQIVRLFQVDPLSWLICDYAGRGGGLLILAAVPQARLVAFARDPRALAWWKVLIAILSLTVFERLCWYASHWVFPSHGIGSFPAPRGWLRVVDLLFGLALVAYSEEIVFRRCARHVLRSRFGDGLVMAIVSSVIFAAYHWTSGVSTIVTAGLFGFAAMIFLVRSEAVWALVTAHYLADVIAFY